MGKNPPDNEELRRVRAEAAAPLMSADERTTQPKSESTANGRGGFAARPGPSRAPVLGVRAGGEGSASVLRLEKEKAMGGKLQKVSLIVALWAGAVTPGLAADVPFKGVFSGQAISAVPTDDPGVLLIITVGSGNATQLGSFTMVSPHLSYLMTLEVEGTQTFTAANGDTLTATFSGQFTVIAGGLLAARIDCAITGGTGRFTGAGGGYTFDIVFDPATLTDQSVIDGTIVLADGD